MCTHTQSCAHTQPPQRWEERATVTNSFGATKVAGNLSNGTIKLQLSFFSFFIADACILVASPRRCNYPSRRRGPCTVREFVCVYLTSYECIGLFTHTVCVKFCCEKGAGHCTWSREETALILCNYRKKGNYGLSCTKNNKQFLQTRHFAMLQSETPTHCNCMIR